MLDKQKEQGIGERRRHLYVSFPDQADPEVLAGSSQAILRSGRGVMWINTTQKSLEGGKRVNITHPSGNQRGRDKQTKICPCLRSAAFNVLLSSSKDSCVVMSAPSSPRPSVSCRVKLLNRRV